MKLYSYVRKTAMEFIGGDDIKVDLPADSITELTIKFNLEDSITFDYSSSPIVFTPGTSLNFMLDRSYFECFKQMQIIMPNMFITDKIKRFFFELQDGGSIFCISFRQEIYPKLQTRIKFLTLMKVVQE